VQIAVASGKGGTGKTTVATSLALSLSDNYKVAFLDCDVEAPNGHLFLQPELTETSDAVIRIPHIDKDICSLCGTCVEVCQFHALAKVGKTIMVFPQLCHGCGSCTWNCPAHAIEEVPNPIGQMMRGSTPQGIHFGHGVLTISEPMATPIIRQLKRLEKNAGHEITILDAPPGASCSVVETLRGSDFAILVTEPTPFGLHDLGQMQGIVEDMNIPAGVIINRQNGSFQPLIDFCEEHHLPILMQIPFERRIAEGIAQGIPLVEIDPGYLTEFRAVYEKLSLMAKNRLKK
jgi:MinD superfamily P-loop ATPase